MAREQICHNRIVEKHVSQENYGVEDVPDAIRNVEIPRNNVHVQWDRGPEPGHGYVQLGIDFTVAELRSLLTHAEQQADAEARRYADIGELDTEQFQIRAMSDVLDRREVNLAINALRRARDVAYGKDA